MVGGFRYFFAIRWPDREDGDFEGEVFPNSDAAREHARRVILELKESAGYDDPDLVMVVSDSPGKAVCTIPF
jgi:hypothetical protein